MAETEILNVGGPQGVASEATLLKLIDLTRQQQRGQGSAAQAEAKLRQTHNAAIKKGSENVGILGKAAQAGAKAFDTYTKVLKDGVGGVSDFTDSMKFLPSTMKSLIRFADASTHQFRELSQVGAGFSNSIFEMNKVAATSGMAMTDFYETVQANSTTMRFLSGSVQEGAKRFAEVSHGLRSSDLGETLFNMGFSIGEINEGFLTYTNNMQRQGLLQGMSNRELIEGSADYLKQIDLLSKATGASRKEFMQQTEALQESAQFQSLLARAGEGADALTNNLAFAAQTLGGQFTDDLVQISSGTGGLTDLGIALQQVNGGRAFIDLMKNAENMDPTEFMRQFTSLAPDIRDSINSQFSPAAMRLLEGTPLSALFDTLGGFSRAAGINVDKIIEEQEQRDATTSAFAGFQQAVADLTTFITDTFLKSETFASLKILGDSLSVSFAKLFGGEAVDGSFDSASAGITSFVSMIDTFVKEKLILPLTNEVNEFTAHMEGGGNAGTYFKDKLIAAGNKILDFFLGEKQFDQMGPMGPEFKRQGGVLSKMRDTILSAFDVEEGGESFFTQLKNRAFSALGFNTEDGSDSLYTQLKRKIGLDTEEGADSLFTQLTKKIGEAFATMDFSVFDPMVDSLAYMFEGMILSLKNTLNESGLLGDLAVGDSSLATQMYDHMIKGLMEGRLTGDRRAQAIAGLEEDRAATLEGINDVAQTGSFNYTHSPADGESNVDYITRLKNEGALAERSAGYQLIEELAQLNAMIANIPPLPERRIGTLRATGKTTEPEDTTANIHAGERVLNPQEASAYNSQSDLGGAINRLNTTTAQLVTLMKQNNRITSGISNDFLKGSLTV